MTKPHAVKTTATLASLMHLCASPADVRSAFRIIPWDFIAISTPATRPTDGASCRGVSGGQLSEIDRAHGPRCVSKKMCFVRIDDERVLVAGVGSEAMIAAFAGEETSIHSSDLLQR